MKAAINRNSALLAFIHDSGDESARIFEEVFNNEEVKRGAERCISLRINSEDGTLGVFAEQVDQMPAVILTYPDGQQAHLYFAQGEDISISELSEKLSNVKAGTSPQKSTPSYESKNSIFAFYRHFDRMPFLLQLIIYALLISFTGWVGRKLEGSQEELEGIAALIAKIISLFFSIICILLIIGLVIELILDIRDMFRMILWRLGFYGF